MQLPLKQIIAVIILAALLVCRPQGHGLASSGQSHNQSHAFTGKVNANNINVRVDATTGSSVICTLARGQLVEVVWEAYDWYKIRLPKTAPSYIKKNLVECINRPAFLPEPAKCLNAKVTAERVNIRLGPSESSWIVGKADKLTVVNILAERGPWYKIEPVHQSFGWVYKKFVDKVTGKLITPADSKHPIIQVAVIEALN